MKRRLALMAVLLIVFFGALFGYDYWGRMQTQAFFAHYQPPPVPVSVASAELRTIPQRLRSIGTLEAVRQLTLSPEVAGRVTALHFVAGDWVVAGQPLLQLNDAPERGELARLRAEAKVTSLNLERNRKLLGLAVSQSDIDVQQASLDALNAQITTVQARLEQQQLRAPFAGQLGVRQVDLGQYLRAGDPVATLTDLTGLYVNFNLPEESRAALAVGQTLSFTVDAYPGETFEARVIAIDPQIGADTRSIALQASLENPEQRLMPGMFADARLTLAPRTGVLVVPETAVDYTIHGDSVFRVVDGDPLRVERVLVQTGERYNGQVTIVEGLAPGDRVVIAGQVNLQDGVGVTLVPSDTLDAARAKARQARP